jgi:hypothetical protein
MLRLTVLLIVVTLTGLPVLPAACLTWCGEHRTTIGFCHDEAVKNGLPVVSAATVTCTALLADGTFVREEARPVLHAVQTLPVFGAVAPPPTAPLLAHLHRGVIDPPLNARLVLRV